MEIITRINIKHCAYELNVSVYEVEEAISHVGRSFEDVKEYLQDYHNCGANLKIGNFKAKGTAFLIEEKNIEIKLLKQTLENNIQIIDKLNQRIFDLESITLNNLGEAQKELALLKLTKIKDCIDNCIDELQGG